jgi:hypothetical protein
MLNVLLHEETFMPQKSVDEIKKVLDSQPLVAIDDALDAFSSHTKETQPKDIINSELFVILCQAIFQSQDIKYVNNSNLVDLLFDKTLTDNQKRFIGSCLLRLLNCYGNLLNSTIIYKILELFDEVFARDLYDQFKIELKSQTYEKENKLKDIVRNLETEFKDLLDSLNDLNLIKSFRNDFPKKLNNKISQAIIWPFSPRQLVEKARLTQIFQSIEQYLEEPGVKKVQIFAETKKIMTDYLDLAQNYGTKYSRNYLGGFAEKVLELLEKDFQNNPLSKPAELDIYKSEKKYPFLIETTKFYLNLVVRNEGPGQAFDVSFKLTDISDNIRLDSSERYLGHLELISITVPIPCEVTRSEKQAILLGELVWKNFDKSESKKEFCLEFESQSSNIDWDSLAIEEPYSLEPAITEDELVGRTEQLNKLIARSKPKSIGSSYILGQKRVGKTSIARTLKARLTMLFPSNYLVIYLEGGDYVHQDPAITIENLGIKICEQIKQSNSLFYELKIPVFNGALASLNSFLESVIRIVPEYKILFILDEFDELPIEVYKRGPIGDTFFLSLRAISAKTNFGFLLVGGEKMEFIISTQGDKLNKFEALRIDYFENPQSDFKELVRKPVAEWNIEISERAIYELYQQTGGNPYFTKQICGELFKLIVNRRDGHITPNEVEEATKITISKLASNSFLHFWKDGIFETGDRAEEISMNRRKVFLALAEISRRDPKINKEKVIEQAIKYGLNEPLVKSELRDFERRQIIVSEDDTFYKYKVPLFGKWLQEKGINEIITTFTDLDALLLRKKQEEEAYVRSEEIVKLTEKWRDCSYLDRPITEDKVRAWLKQFPENTEQRLMFQILQHLKFYNGDNLRNKMKEAHGIIVRGGLSVRKYETEKQRRRSDILVSYLDKPSKSGAYYAKLFADENEIYANNIIERGKIAKTLKDETQMQKIKALVFIDDFIGTGGSACQYFEELAHECGELLRNPNLIVFFISVSGFQEAKTRLKAKLVELNVNVNVHICDPLDESAKVFSDRSKVFSKPGDLEQAKNVAFKYGSSLFPQHPLGYGDCQAAVVFADACPNNTLPILWSDSGWTPLFKRQ